MTEAFNYSQLLRPVGQMLEPLRIEVFSLRLEDEGVSVRAQKPASPPPPPEVSLRVVWQAFRRKKTEPVLEPQPLSGVFELHYSHDDIRRMDSEGKTRRQGGGSSPETHSLSQILRAVGAFVDEKQGRLFGITKSGLEITIEYESVLRQKLIEKHTVSSLYDYWVKMYLRRRDRA